MKGKLNGIGKEILAFALAALFVYLVLFLFSFFNFSSSLATQKTKLISGPTSPTRGTQANYELGEQGELHFMSSLARKNQITLLGSSEMNDSPYASYHFLPDSVGIPAMGFGHAFHQCFAMYCELLAAEEYLENAKVCILLSPGWFVTEGTNTEAFVEFVPSNFLSRIYNNPKVSNAEKDFVGQYISKHKADFSGLTKAMKSLADGAEKRQKLFSVSLTLQKWLSQQYEMDFNPIRNANYKTLGAILAKKNFNISPSVYARLEKEAIQKSKNNNMFVDSSYYRTILLDENGKLKPGVIADIALQKNTELEDFKQLVKLLKSRKVDATFVIQSLNPYYYQNMKGYEPLIALLTKELDQAGIPYLNMYTTEKSKYRPGMLSDVMHLGDLGWMQINSFLLQTYSK